MSYPKAYDPQDGYKYHILTRMPGTREWEHCDYATSKKDKDFLLGEYALAYRGFDFKIILQPAKYCPKSNG